MPEPIFSWTYNGLTVAPVNLWEAIFCIAVIGIVISSLLIFALRTLMAMTQN